jgi:nucleotide-binding universal stress UspA family protein
MESTMHLLLAIDHSESAERAIQEVLRRPWPTDLRIRVLSVMDEDPGSTPAEVPVPSAPVGEVPPWPAGTLATRGLLDANARHIAEAAAQRLAAQKLRAEICVREGSPGPEIVEAAKDWPAELIVVGSRGLGPIKRLLLGSVANYVVNHAHCSVLVVR